MKEFASKASDLVENLAPEELGPINEKLHLLLKSQKEDIGLPTFRQTTGTKQVDPAVFNWIRNLGTPSSEVKQITENIEKSLAKSIGKDEAAQYISDLTNFSKKYNVIKDIAGGTGKGTLYQETHKLRNLPAIVGNMYGMTQKALLDTATSLKLTNNPMSQKLSEIVTTIANSPQERRAALLFAVSQNKDYRDLIGKTAGSFLPTEENLYDNQ